MAERLGRYLRPRRRRRDRNRYPARRHDHTQRHAHLQSGVAERLRGCPWDARFPTRGLGVRDLGRGAGHRLLHVARRLAVDGDCGHDRGRNTLTADTGFVDSSDRSCTFGCHQSNASPLTSCSNAPSHKDPSTGLQTTACQFVTSSAQRIPCTASGTYSDHTAFTSSSTFPLTGRDFYDLSRCAGVTLRIDLLNTAAQSLMDTRRHHRGRPKPRRLSHRDLRDRREPGQRGERP